MQSGITRAWIWDTLTGSSAQPPRRLFLRQKRVVLIYLDDFLDSLSSSFYCSLAEVEKDRDENPVELSISWQEIVTFLLDPLLTIYKYKKWKIPEKNS